MGGDVVVAHDVVDRVAGGEAEPVQVEPAFGPGCEQRPVLGAGVFGALQREGPVVLECRAICKLDRLEGPSAAADVADPGSVVVLGANFDRGVGGGQKFVGTHGDP
jgi:hypothetical protein